MWPILIVSIIARRGRARAGFLVDRPVDAPRSKTDRKSFHCD